MFENVVLPTFRCSKRSEYGVRNNMEFVIRDTLLLTSSSSIMLLFAVTTVEGPIHIVGCVTSVVRHVKVLRSNILSFPVSAVIFPTQVSWALAPVSTITFELPTSTSLATLISTNPTSFSMVSASGLL